MTETSSGTKTGHDVVGARKCDNSEHNQLCEHETMDHILSQIPHKVCHIHYSCIAIQFIFLTVPDRRRSLHK